MFGEPDATPLLRVSMPAASSCIQLKSTPQSVNLFSGSCGETRITSDRNHTARVACSHRLGDPHPFDSSTVPKPHSLEERFTC